MISSWEEVTRFPFVNNTSGPVAAEEGSKPSDDSGGTTIISDPSSTKTPNEQLANPKIVKALPMITILAFCGANG